MHINIVAIRVETPIEYKRSVHERTWINEGATLPNLHLLNVKHEAPIEDLERQGRFTTKDQNFILCNLVGQSHVRWHPPCLVDQGRWNFLPNIS